MTEKIYEYKDTSDWYIGQWGEYPYLTSFQNDEQYEHLQSVFTRFKAEEKDRFLQVHIVKYTSDFQFASFLADMINQEDGRAIQVCNYKGAVLLLENETVLDVLLPKTGVPIAAFFGEERALMADFTDKILIATRNEGKTREFRQFFERWGYQVENLNQYPDLPDVAETGTTFEENARLKAETIAKLTGKMVLADDSGLKVDKLGGLPGVWSARFAGADATDERNNAKLLHELAMVFEQKDRSAQFHCTLVMAAPDTESLVVEADWNGYIAFGPQGENGFGYDPLFLVGETGKTSAQMMLEEKNKISHRAKALEKLVEAFPVWQKEIAKQS